MEYINHLDYIMDPVIEKLPGDIASGIQGLPAKCGIEVESKPHGSSILAIPPTDDQAIQADGKKQGEQGAKWKLMVLRA